MYGGVARWRTRHDRECIVRNISDNGASIEFSNDFQLPKEQLSLRIAPRAAPSSPRWSGARQFRRRRLQGETPPRRSPISRSGCAEARSRSAQLQRRIDELLNER